MSSSHPRSIRLPGRIALFAAIAIGLAPHSLLAAGGAYSLDDLLHMADTGNRSVLAARNQVEAAQAAISTAGAFPNPEVEYLSGQSRARMVAASPGDLRSITVTQPLPLPGQLGLREEAASAVANAAGAELASFEAASAARVKLHYYELLRRDAERRAAKEDAALMAQIRSRIELRVEVGEAPRYELIKADTELLNARKSETSAGLRAQQARAALREMVGELLPADFTVAGELDSVGTPGADLRTILPLATLRDEVMARNPELARARAELQRAESQLALERSLRLPSVSLRASQEQDPELRSSRVGLVLTVPLWNQRSGPVGEATAQLARARNTLAAQEFALARSIEFAYSQFEIAHTQVLALEAGIVRQAEAALRVAEAAYRFGERGILDYLDAQRVFRAARNDLITARYELVAARVDIERLRTPAAAADSLKARP